MLKDTKDKCGQKIIIFYICVVRPLRLADMINQKIYEESLLISRRQVPFGIRINQSGFQPIIFEGLKN